MLGENNKFGLGDTDSGSLKFSGQEMTGTTTVINPIPDDMT
ncbi:MAG: hypothetical protein RLN62_07045 [Rickettsiales bacterium]